MFSGLSSLRKAEKKEPTVHNKALQDYLAKQYGAGSGAGGGGEQQQQEGRKKKKKKVKQTGAAVVILDHDLSGLAPVPDAPQQRAQAAAAAAAAADNSGDDDGGVGCAVVAWCEAHGRAAGPAAMHSCC
jgi:hypothetical protein